MLKGFTKTCGKKVAGVVKILLIPSKDIKSVTFDTQDTEAISALTLAQGAAFAKYEFMEKEAEFQENYKTENGSHAVEQKIIFKFEGMTPESRAGVEEIVQASYCGLVAAVVRKGHIQIVGWDADFEGERPLRLESTTGTSGKATTDPMGEEITLSRESSVKAHYFLGEESALTTPTGSGA